MVDLDQSSVPVQIEATRFRSSVSENLIQTLGGAINYALKNAMPLGSVIASMLTEAQYQDQTSTGWVLADGRSCASSAYAVLTGFTTVPDMRGVFVRGKNGARSAGTGNPSGDVALGTYQADEVKAHSHTFPLNPSALVENGGPLVHDDGSEFSITPVTATASSNGAESRPRNVTMNYFIRID